MKGLKKFFTGILAGAMALSMMISAGTTMTAKAAETAATKGSITITNAVAGQEYKVWRVFDYTAADATKMKDGGVYTLAANFKNFKKDEYFTVGDNGILNTNGITNSTVAEFGKAAFDYAIANKIKADGTATADSNGKVVISGLEYGYYVVDSSLGSAVAVNTTIPNANIEEKNDVPDIKKSVQENSTPETKDLTGNDAQIGDVITFTVVVNLKKGGSNYKLVDTMTDGLTFGEIKSVTFSDEKKAVKHTETTSEHGFEMSFAEPTDHVDATVVYTAKLNTSAKIAAEENVNTAYLVYGNNTETTHKQTVTKTYPMLLKKVAEGTDTVLEGAVFKMYRKNTGEQLKFSVKGTVYTVDPNGTVTELTTVKDTPLTVNGLDSETYILEETKAPAGYNLLTTEVEANGKTYTHAKEVVIPKTSTTKEGETFVALVEDGTGLTLPSTGGIGTTIFYIIGGLLIVAAVVFFVVRRKADAE